MKKIAQKAKEAARAKQEGSEGEKKQGKKPGQGKE